MSTRHRKFQPSDKLQPPKHRKLSDHEQKEVVRKVFMDKIQALFRNVQAMEDRLKRKGRVPMEDKSYRRSAGALAQSVKYAREQGWMGQSTQTNS